MKKILLLLLIVVTVSSCEGSGSSSDNSEFCSYNGKALHVGEKGGCYYINSTGNKEYVDKSYCKNCY